MTTENTKEFKGTKGEWRGDIEKFIDTIRETDFYIEIIYMRGGCYQFHLLLKSLFDCEAYITPNKCHVVSKYNNKYYDIMGEYTKDIPTKMTEEEVIMAEKWSFYRNNKLKITECPYCESPIIFTEFKAGDKATLTIRGLGSGVVDIVKHEGDLCIFNESEGYLRMTEFHTRNDLRLDKV